MQFIIVDLEATCWAPEEGDRRAAMEIIEIGALRLASPRGPMVDEFASFVCPSNSPVLSDFCRQLTSIRQADVEAAAQFPEVLERFCAWIGAEPYTLCSWGNYDLIQFRRDCERHELELPAGFERHLNLKAAFSILYHTRPLGMAGALRKAGLPLEGIHHRGIDDARNIARLALLILPQLEELQKLPE